MEHSYRDQVMAFAGIWQSVSLVKQIAYTGNANSHDFEVCIKSLFVTDPKNVDEIYGSAKGVESGLKVILEQFGDATTYRDMELTKYVISLMHLERKLSKNQDLLRKVSKGLDFAKNQAEHFTHTHENVIARLGDLYSTTISTIPPKIIVSGEQGHLSNSDNAAKVRALLLAGIRSTVLWHQCGGHRLKLLFSRRKLLDQTKIILEETY